jgi:predicted helicase
VFNLRGNQRTSGELSRKEGGKIFGSGSRTPIAITLLVKKPAHTGKADIYYYEVDDYLSREEKLSLVKKLGSVGNPQMPWQKLHPNEHGDWINHRNDRFSEFISLAPDKKFDGKAKAFFTTYAVGVATGRDSWVYNFSRSKVTENMERMILFYNEQTQAYQDAKRENPNLKVEDFIETDEKKIAWTRALRNDVQKGLALSLQNDYRICSYRPFTKQYLYFDESFIESPGLSRKLFPLPSTENLVICTMGIGANKDYSVLISNNIPDYQLMFNNQYLSPL